MLDYYKTKNARVLRQASPLTPARAALYALSVGLGRDPLDSAQLPFVYEGAASGMQVLPSIASVLIGPSDFLADCGWDYAHVLHGEERVAIHAPLRAGMEYTVAKRVLDVYDKGSGRGAVVLYECTAAESSSGAVVATVTRSMFARRDGGCDGNTAAAPSSHALPERPPDTVLRVETMPWQALLYRLNGDLNPLHADPERASVAGFQRPILHGLCLQGIVCAALVGRYSAGRPALLRALDLRFQAPVFPGETILIDVWVGANGLSFRCRALERDVIAISNGRCVIE